LFRRGDEPNARNESRRPNFANRTSFAPETTVK
jgi:hypothetical protein